MPDPIPVMVIGRLAVDRNWQSLGIELYQKYGFVPSPVARMTLMLAIAAAKNALGIVE